jgi:hypothetical protein
MRTFLTAAFLAVALTLSGCAGFGVKNPLSPTTMDKVDAAYGTVAAVAANYVEACAARVIPNSCRLVVPKLQAYDRKTYTAVVAARNFTDRYPDLNAVTVLLAAQQAITDFRNFQVSQGVK